LTRPAACPVFPQDGPLDLRFDQTKGVSAYEYLNTVDRDELVRVLTLYGDGVDTEGVSRRVADAICIKRATGGLPTRTREFAKFVAAVKGKEYQGFHPAKLVFQSLRIHLNDEFDELRRGLAAAYEIMPDNGDFPTSAHVHITHAAATLGPGSSLAHGFVLCRVVSWMATYTVLQRSLGNHHMETLRVCYCPRLLAPARARATRLPDAPVSS